MAQRGLKKSPCERYSCQKLPHLLAKTLDGAKRTFVSDTPKERPTLLSKLTCIQVRLLSLYILNVGKCGLHDAIGNTSTPPCEEKKLRNDSYARFLSTHRWQPQEHVPSVVVIRALGLSWTRTPLLCAAYAVRRAIACGSREGIGCPVQGWQHSCAVAGSRRNGWAAERGIYGFSNIEGTTQCAEALIAKKAGGVLCAVASLEGERGGKGAEGHVGRRKGTRNATECSITIPHHHRGSFQRFVHQWRSLRFLWPEVNGQVDSVYFGTHYHRCNPNRITLIINFLMSHTIGQPLSPNVLISFFRIVNFTFPSVLFVSTVIHHSMRHTAP